MDMEIIRKNAKEKLAGFCVVCPICNGKACAGQVPGMGGIGTGASFIANIEALASYKLNMRTIHDKKEPDTSLDLWGIKLTMPILAAPMTGTTYNMGGKITEEEFIHEIVAGSIGAGTIAMTGDGADPEMYGSGIKAISKHNGRGIAIIKPRSQEEIIKRIRTAEQAGALAVGIDIDGAGLITMALKGQPVSTKSFKELVELVQSTNLPFIIKGIMTPDEAELSVNTGAKAIVVSNHGGRILDHMPGSADVLPQIAEKVKGKITIFADGGIRSGADVLKMLALGADAVLIGRPLAIASIGGGREGVEFVLKKLKGELSQAMLLTGTGDVRNVSKNIIYT